MCQRCDLSPQLSPIFYLLPLCILRTNNSTQTPTSNRSRSFLPRRENEKTTTNYTTCLLMTSLTYTFTSTPSIKGQDPKRTLSKATPAFNPLHNNTRNQPTPQQHPHWPDSTTTSAFTHSTTTTPALTWLHNNTPTNSVQECRWKNCLALQDPETTASHDIVVTNCVTHDFLTLTIKARNTAPKDLPRQYVYYRCYRCTFLVYILYQLDAARATSHALDSTIRWHWRAMVGRSQWPGLAGLWSLMTRVARDKAWRMRGNCTLHSRRSRWQLQCRTLPTVKSPDSAGTIWDKRKNKDA